LFHKIGYEFILKVTAAGLMFQVVQNDIRKGSDQDDGKPESKDLHTERLAHKNQTQEDQQGCQDIRKLEHLCRP
jgi:hypothetical protein